MNAQQRKQARKQKRLVNLGRDAAVHIAAAEHDVAATAQVLATRDADLAKTLGKARTLEEAVMMARVEAAKADARAEAAYRESQLALTAADDDHKLTMATVVRELNQAHARELEKIHADHLSWEVAMQTKTAEARARELEKIHANHLSWEVAMQTKMAELHKQLAQLEAEAEEPAKLRRRLHERQQLVEALQKEVIKLRAQLAPEPIHVPFINRRRAP